MSGYFPGQLKIFTLVLSAQNVILYENGEWPLRIFGYLIQQTGNDRPVCLFSLCRRDYMRFFYIQTIVKFSKQGAQGKQDEK